MAKRWRIHPHDPDRIAALRRAAGIPAVVAQLLICRGITDPAGRAAVSRSQALRLRDPELLPGCCEAAERIHAAIAARQRIVDLRRLRRRRHDRHRHPLAVPASCSAPRSATTCRTGSTKATG